MPSDGAVAAQLLLFSVSLHYLQNISSIYFLAHVSVLSHQVAQSLKRLLVIACSVFYFHTPVTALNVIGMSLALVGFFAYSLAKQTAAASISVNGEGWSASPSKAAHSPHANGLYSSHSEGREWENEKGYSSSGTSSRLRVASQPNTPRQPGDQHHSSSPLSSASNASITSAASSMSQSAALPSSLTSESAVLDSYALVRASELGSSHLLQSPATGPVQVQLRYPHSNSHNTSNSNSYTLMSMQPLSLPPHSHQQQQLPHAQQRRASRDQSAGTLQHADNVGLHSSHSHVVEMEEHAGLLAAHDDYNTAHRGNHNGMR